MRILSWMRRILLLVLILSPVQAKAGNETVPEADSRAIIAVITAQLRAFRRENGPLAFSYASPGIQEKFGSAQTFMAMVRNGYAAVYRPHAVEFLESRRRGGITAQAVYFVGPDGRAVIAIYLMERQPDGSWRIDGVSLTPVAQSES